MNLKEIFDKHDSESHKFDRVENKRSNRADLHAFLLLDQLVPGTYDIVAAAEYDQIFLEIDPLELKKVASEEQIIELIRCGVWLDCDTDSLSLFV